MIWYFFAVAGTAASLACDYFVPGHQGGRVAAVLLALMFVVPGAIVGTVFLVLWRTGRDFKNTPHGSL